MLSSNRRGTLIAAALIALVVAVAFAAYWTIFRTRTSAQEMMSALPVREGVRLYLDVAAIRKAGYLKLFSGAEAGSESKQFADQTGFQFERDLDAVAMEIAPEGIYYVVSGDFSPRRLEEYARKQGGECRERMCRVAASTPGRSVSFFELRPGLMAAATAQDPWGASLIGARPAGNEPPEPAPPVWILVPAGVLREASGFPAGTKAFTSPLSEADRIVFTIEPEGDSLVLTADVTCRAPDGASVLHTRLEAATEALRRMLARENMNPGPRDLATLLINGKFSVAGPKVLARWPLRREFLENLAGGGVQ